MAPSEDQLACVIPGGFTVLSLRFSEDETHALHQMCVKEHRVRSESNTDRPLDRTLFVLNVPPYCTQRVLTDVFSRFGSIQSVELSDKPGASESSDSDLSKYFRATRRQCFRVAYIVFSSESGVRAAKRHPQSVPLTVSTAERPVRTGVSKWIQQYSESLVNASALQGAVDQFMTNFDRRKTEEAERLKKEAEQQQEDEEGWVKVTKAKARPHSETANQRTLQKEDKKKQRKELLNFYSWQHRNTQKEHIAELRKKFEEDKQRIAILRAQRKFRPF
ncbi:ribosomal RNA-processing protein 7 homolog A [Ctenopharyngodon idella]|uniref:ribosomal RNA-processing protein 7 homolog A n=1 Tax=Ctenopharyngodon idella TaxID=7959 RepID=UPI0022315E3C|nr:ribosomal RNA-processing protein 7 homolog A [Ctenopharyngodon idella]